MWQLKRLIFVTVVTFVGGLSACTGGEGHSHNTETSESVRARYMANESLWTLTMEAQLEIDRYEGRKESLRSAQELLDKVLGEDEQYVPALIEQARIILSLGHLSGYDYRPEVLDSVLSILQNAVDISPLFGETYVLLGAVQTYNGDAEAGLETLMYASIYEAENPWLTNNMAFSHMRMQNIEGARLMYQKSVDRGVGTSLKDRASYLDALYCLMQLDYRASRVDTLPDIANKMLAVVGPEDAWSRGNVGSLLCNAGYFEKGTPLMREALAIMNYGVGRNSLGMCLYGTWAEFAERGERDKAQSIFEEAYSLRPNIEALAKHFTRGSRRMRELAPLLNEKFLELKASGSI